MKFVWIGMIDDIENAVKDAKNSKHLSKSQNATEGMHKPSHDSVIIHPLGIIHTFGTSIVGATVTVLVAGALKPA